MDGTAHGERTCLSNGSGATSNTRRCPRYDSVSQARSGLYLNFHNSRRPHSGHGGSTPDQAYFTRAIPYGSLTPPAAVPSIDAETTGTSSISLEGHSNGDTLPMLQFPDQYRSATCSVMEVAAKEEVREQHDQRHVIRQPGLRSTNQCTDHRSPHRIPCGSRLPETRQPFEEQLAIKDFQVSRKAEALRSRATRQRQAAGWNDISKPPSRLGDQCANRR